MEVGECIGCKLGSASDASSRVHRMRVCVCIGFKFASRYRVHRLGSTKALQGKSAADGPEPLSGQGARGFGRSGRGAFFAGCRSLIRDHAWTGVPIMSHGGLVGTGIGVERCHGPPESVSGKKSPAILEGVENIFRSMFIGGWRTLGVNYPEKVGVSVRVS